MTAARACRHMDLAHVGRHSRRAKAGSSISNWRSIAASRCSSSWLSITASRAVIRAVPSAWCQSNRSAVPGRRPRGVTTHNGRQSPLTAADAEQRRITAAWGRRCAPDGCSPGPTRERPDQTGAAPAARRSRWSDERELAHAIHGTVVGAGGDGGGQRARRQLGQVVLSVLGTLTVYWIAERSRSMRQGLRSRTLRHRPSDGVGCGVHDAVRAQGAPTPRCLPGRRSRVQLDRRHDDRRGPAGLPHVHHVSARGAVLDVVLGAAACGYAAGVWTRRRSEPSRDDRAHRILTQRRLKNLKVTGATLIGVITRLTGLLPVPVGRILRRRAAAVPTPRS